MRWADLSGKCRQAGKGGRQFVAALFFQALAFHPEIATAQLQLDPGRSPQPQIQKPLTEAQKRRLLLPHIRAATECYANQLRQKPQLAEAFQQSRIRFLISESFGACVDQLEILSRQHDALYGAGTGSAFITGPYNTDLERAVIARVRPEIDRQLAVVARQQAEENARMAAIEAEKQKRLATVRETQKLLLHGTYECANGQISRLINSNERAEVIAEAAMTLCAKEVRAAVEASNNLMQADRPSFRQSYEGDEIIRGAIRKNVQANAVVLRAERNSAPTKPSGDNSAPQLANDGKVRECLKVANTIFSKVGSDKAVIIRSMMDLCRPEIEETARSAFLTSPSNSLDDARAQTLKRAADYSEGIAGTSY